MTGEEYILADNWCEDTPYSHKILRFQRKDPKDKTLETAEEWTF